ncbi:hypothetical protein CHU98_g9091 [Xylaria longipes]|nr:hypothetical protein CHU98_g9091 [Xylaria longipes]
MGDTDNADNTAQLAATMDSSTQAHQTPLEVSMDSLAWVLMQASPRRAVSESGAEKRDFDLAFPLTLGRSAKRARSPPQALPQAHLFPENNRGDALDNSSINVEDAIENDVTITAHMPSETLRASPTSSSLHPALLQRAPDIETNAPKSSAASHLDDTKHVEHSRNEICKHMITIKQNTPNCQIDPDTAAILVNELGDLMAAESLATAEQIVQMRCSVAKYYCAATSPARIECGQENPQIARSPVSSISELTSIPSDIYTLPPSLRGTEAVSPPPKLENRSTQTEMATINSENEGLVLSDSRYNDHTDIELWERELESIRRLRPLNDGSYTIVNVPLREYTSQSASASRGITLSTMKGSGNEGNPISKLKPTPGPLQPGTVASGKRGHKDYDVISVHDTSDDEGLPARASHVVGGGDLIYGRNELLYATGNEDEETNSHGSRFKHELQLDGNNDAIDSCSNYEDYDMDEDIQGEEVIQYANQHMDSMVDHDNNISDDGHRSDDSLFLSEGSGESYESGNWDPPRTTADRSAMVTYRGTTICRDRSRSPGYQRARFAEKTPYREERQYPHKYTVGNSPIRSHREKQYNTGRVSVKGVSASTGRVSQYGHVRQRYMRDEPESPRFYGYSGKWSPKEAESTLRYQDRFNDVGEIPGPKSNMRLDLDRYIKDTCINDDALGLERNIESVHENTFYAGETLDEEQALRRSWANKPTTLYKGFPLVENIGFVTIGNHAKPEGDCYWRALAYILYGQPTRWDLIKADHQAYLRHVLSDKTHPRHELYAKLNTQFFETHGPALQDGIFAVTSVFKANLWQLLHMPHSWTPGVMQQVTADLYNIHLVTFEYHKRNNLCSNVSVRGAYNSRHVFMLFMDGCHFQPLAVNEYLG